MFEPLKIWVKYFDTSTDDGTSESDTFKDYGTSEIHTSTQYD